MSHHSKLVLGALMAAALMPAPGSAKDRPTAADFAYKGTCHSWLEQPRLKAIQKLDARLLPGTRGEIKPDNTLPQSRIFGDLDGPDGRLWFYRADFEYDYNQVSEYYTEDIMRSYTFTVYDADFREVGTVHDKVTYGENETRVPACSLAPFVTRRFFNGDDKYEVVVGLTVNTTKYVNNDYSIVYSIGGERKEGCDVPLLTVNKIVGDVLNASTDSEERFYVTFMQDANEEVPDKDYDNLDPDDPDTMGFWANLISYGISYEVCGAAGADGKLQTLHEGRLRLCDLPGDQESSAWMISYMSGGKPYFLFSGLEDSFFEPYYNFMDESYMRKDNHLLVNIYTPAGGKLEQVQATSIPTQLLSDGNDHVLATYYSVGSMRYREDIVPADNGKFNFVVTVQNYTTLSDESYDQFYWRYNSEGVKTSEIYGECEGFVALSDIPGQDPEGFFIDYNLVGDYVLNFVNLRTDELLFSQDIKFEIDDYSDPEGMTSNIDRVMTADGMRYVCELRSPRQDDETGEDYMRFLWFGRNGKFDRIDEVNMGSGVHYAKSFISNTVLKPGFYNEGDKHSYMILVKRGYADDSIKEELMVAQATDLDNPEGVTLLSVGPDSERGVLGQISIFEDVKTPRMMISYVDTQAGKYSVDFYDLPLIGSAGVDGVIADAENAVQYNGTEVVAEGCGITVYALDGAVVARGYGRVDVSALGKGLYIASTPLGATKISVR